MPPFHTIRTHDHWILHSKVRHLTTELFWFSFRKGVLDGNVHVIVTEQIVRNFFVKCDEKADDEKADDEWGVMSKPMMTKPMMSKPMMTKLMMTKPVTPIYYQFCLEVNELA